MLAGKWLRPSDNEIWSTNTADSVRIYAQLRHWNSGWRSSNNCALSMGATAVMQLLTAQSVASFPVLNALIIVPVVGALVVVLLPNSRPELMRPVGAIFAAIAGAFSLYVMAEFSVQDPGFQLQSIQSWIPSLGINWHVGVDGISLWLVVLTGLITPIVLIAVDPHHDPKPYTAWLLLLQAGSFGAFLALDLFLFHN